MTNFEKYKDRIKDISNNKVAIVRGEPVDCNNTLSCSDCELSCKTPCQFYATEWLMQQADGEPSSEITDARKQGQEEAWKLARKINLDKKDGGLTLHELAEVFEGMCTYEVLRDCTYAEAAEKVREWEEEKKRIKVGDVVESLECTGVVMRVDGSITEVIDGDGKSIILSVKECIKTGRTLPVEDWLRQIG